MTSSNIGLIKDFFTQVGSTVSEKDKELAVEVALLNDGNVDKQETTFLKDEKKLDLSTLLNAVRTRNIFSTPLSRFKTQTSQPISSNNHTVLLARLLVNRMANSADADQLVKFVKEHPETAKPVIDLLKQKELIPTYFSQYGQILLTYAETLQPLSKKENSSFTVLGKTYSNPFAWLYKDDAITKEWETKQGNAANAYFDNIPGYSKIKSFVEANYVSAIFPSPQVSQGYVYYLQTEDKSKSPLIYKRKLDGSDKPTIVFQLTNAENPSKNMLVQFNLSPDGTKMVAMISKGGSDERIHKIIHLKDHKVISTIDGVKNSGAGWGKDSSGLYYSAYVTKDGKPHNEKIPDEELYHRVFYRDFKSNNKPDQLIYKNDDREDLEGIYTLETTNDGKRLLLTIEATKKKPQGVYSRLIDSHEDFTLLLPNSDSKSTIIDSKQNELIVFTTENAPRGKVISFSADSGNKAAPWTKHTLVPEHETLIMGSAVTAGGKIIVHYLENTFSKVKIYQSNGVFDKDLQVPAHSCIEDHADFYYLAGRVDDTKVVALISNPLSPPKLMVANLNTGTVQSLEKTNSDLNSPLAMKYENYVVETVITHRPDHSPLVGTFIYPKDTKKDGKLGILMDVYMGYGNPRTPWFENKYVPILRAGGGVMIVHGRGGGDFGQENARLGMKENGNNPMLDTIFMAQALVKKGWTSKGKIVVNGGSHGGLVSTSAVLQNAMSENSGFLNYVIAPNGSLNILHTLTRAVPVKNAQYWIDNHYGDPNRNAQIRDVIAGYSPMQLALAIDPSRITDPLFYFPVTVGDDRVLSREESYPVTAALQSKGGHVLLRTYPGGHGAQLEDARMRGITDASAIWMMMMGINPETVFRN